MKKTKKTDAIKVDRVDGYPLPVARPDLDLPEMQIHVKRLLTAAIKSYNRRCGEDMLVQVDRGKQPIVQHGLDMPGSSLGYSTQPESPELRVLAARVAALSEVWVLLGSLRERRTFLAAWMSLICRRDILEPGKKPSPDWWCSDPSVRPPLTFEAGMALTNRYLNPIPATFADPGGHLRDQLDREEQAIDNQRAARAGR